MNALYVFIGGGLGALSRYGVSLLLQQIGPSHFPLATLTSNVISTSILALLIYRMGTPSQALFMLVAVGFCGGFSTFSTFSLETFQLMRSGQYWWAIINVLISVILCLVVLFVIHKSLK